LQIGHFRLNIIIQQAVFNSEIPGFRHISATLTIRGFGIEENGPEILGLESLIRTRPYKCICLQTLTWTNVCSKSGCSELRTELFALQNGVLDLKNPA